MNSDGLASSTVERFDELLRSRTPSTEDELADLIESHGRGRIAAGRNVALEEYLTADPELRDKPDALDAAIDVSLRSLAGGAAITSEAVESLVERHPDLEEAIREAAVLGENILATTEMRAALATPRHRALPADFGPNMENGEPRYELVELLGRGAFGEVYMAVDRRLSEPDKPALVAIKLLTMWSHSRWARQRFIEEATKARRIDHANVVRIFDRGVTDAGEDYIVEEYVDGGDLASHPATRRRPLSERDAARIMLQLARGVQAAHSAALIHCDLKPSNVLMTSDGEPKVCDFGIAIKEGEGDRRHREFEQDRPLGNLAFMSPEQFRREDGSLNARTDVYALGGILYWLLTDDLPNGDSIEGIRRRHAPGEGPEAPTLPGADRDLRLICRRAMATHPEARYSSAAAFANDLESWLNREAIPWTKPSPARVFTLWTRRRPAVSALAALVLLAIAIGSGVGLRLQAIAEQNAMEARIAQVQAEEERKFQQRFVDWLKRNRDQLLFATDDGFKTQALGVLWALDWMAGGDVFNNPGVAQFIWETRIQLVRDIVEERRDLTSPTSIERLLWETSLAFWLANEGEHEESGPLAESLVSRWESILDDDDPWMTQVRSVEAATDINRLHASAKKGGLTTTQFAELREAEQTLRTGWDRTARYDDAGQMRTLIGRALLKAYSAELLNRQDDRRAIREELERLDAHRPAEKEGAKAPRVDE